MSMEKINLRKLLQLIYAEPRQRRSILLAEIRSELSKRSGEEGGGGDFHAPFWADAKNHVAGILDLREQSKTRIQSNKARSRLYPLLTEGFLKMWNEKARWRNEKFELVPTSASSLLPIKELNAIVKIENVVAVEMEDGSHRVVYPYFSERPMLPSEGVRLAFWALKEALPDFRAEDLRIIDVLRGSYFRSAESPLQGDERNIFVEKYDAVLREWRKLRDEP
jgi:hypothetical protein